MVDFTPPFAENGDRRLPDNTEQSLGLSCDTQQLREVLNGIFNLHQGQIKAIADEAGVTPSGAGDKTLLNRAVLALIAAATGGGDTSEFVLFSQARTRLPIFPEVSTTDGRLSVTSPSAGTVALGAGTVFLHRGIFPTTTTYQEFSTDPSKTYHLRWNPTDGFVLRDLASGTYNPGTLAESNIAFDSTFDDMLAARVITNSSNVVTITNLSNKASLFYSENTGRVTDLTLETSNVYGDFGGARRNNTFNYNWGRVPRIDSINAYVGAGSPAPIGVGVGGIANVVFNKVITRYRTVFDVNTDWIGGATSGLYAEIDVRVMA